jgi:hypothetical protein
MHNKQQAKCHKNNMIISKTFPMRHNKEEEEEAKRKSR